MKNWIDGIGYWIGDNLGGLIITMIIGLFIWGLTALMNSDTESRLAFMSLCMEDHKEYECIVMWRAGRSPFIPIVIPVYSP